MKRTSIILTCILFLFNFTSYLYSVAAEKGDIATPQFEGLYLLDENYQITVGDLIMVYLTGDINEVYSFSVPPEGKIIISRTGEIKVADLNIKECRETIKNEMSKYYKNIDVIVHIIKPATKKTISKVEDIITIQGEVNYPGIYNITKGEKISSIVYRAGGFKPRADLRKTYIEREKIRIDIDLYEILVKKNSSLDIEIENGDILNIPAKSNIVNVFGYVYKQGVYEYAINAPVSYYLGLAGGITNQGSSGITVTQFDGKEVDPEGYIPQPGDTIYVPQKFFTLISWRDYMQILFDFLALYSIYIIIFRK